MLSELLLVTEQARMHSVPMDREECGGFSSYVLSMPDCR